MAKDMDSIFSLFDVASVLEVPLEYCSMYNAFFVDLPVSSFVFHSFLLTVKSLNLVVAHDGLLCIMILNRPYFL